MSTLVKGPPTRRIGHAPRPRRWWLRRRYLIAVGLLLLVVAGACVVYFTPLLRARSVTVTGLRALTRQQVVAAADVPADVPLARLDLGAIRHRVADLPRVATVHVGRAWPSGLTIAVRERRAVAVGVHDGMMWLVDRTGRRFAPAPRPTGLPHLATPDASRPAVRAALTVVGSLPAALQQRTVSVSATVSDHVTLALTNGRTVIWGDDRDGAVKSRALLALLKRPGTTYDVSTPPVVVVR